jgi:hypothetical protein
MEDVVSYSYSYSYSFPFPFPFPFPIVLDDPPASPYHPVTC